jgi:choline dehydrogenase-like flavoprotein
MTDSKSHTRQSAPVDYDVVIVGAGISGALVAKFLALADKQRKIRILILEAGEEIKPNNNEALERYYESTSKVPESPYTPEIFAHAVKDANDRVGAITQGQRSDAVLRNPSCINAGRPTVLSVSVRAWQEPDKGQWGGADRDKCDPKNFDVNYFDQQGALPFASTYERIAGGTARHWMGISLRHLPNDFKMGQRYTSFTDRKGKPSPWPDWPLDYATMDPWYARAESEIGVSGDPAVQQHLEEKLNFIGGNLHGYPMAGIPLSYSDKQLNEGLQKNTVTFPAQGGQQVKLEVTQLPVARNSEPFNRRRACAGNSSCIPICPIQAKYDPTITLREALNTGRVSIEYRAVACDIATIPMGPDDQSVTHIEYIKYESEVGGRSVRHTVRARTYVLAGNAIETPRLLLMSNGQKGILPGEMPVGRYLMDHPFMIASATSQAPVYPYRGPLVTAGIEMLRDGEFRRRHASFRTDISNSGWSLTTHGTAQTLAEDFITGGNSSGKNGGGDVFGGQSLMTALHDILTRQVSLGFLVEQTPDWENCVTLSDLHDGLGLPRPRIEYDFSNYTKDGLAEAAALAKKIFHATGCDEYPDEPGPGTPIPPDSCSFDWKDAETGKPIVIHYMGAGHIAGTCRMGVERKTSVVDSELKVWGFNNLYVIGSAVFPTLGTANPTLTIAALALRLADHLSGTFKSAGMQSV